MGHRHGMSAVAGLATLLAALPLANVFATWQWLLYAIVVIVVIGGSATLARVLHAPAGVQVLAMMAALVLILTWMFPSGDEFARLLPSLDTFQHFNQLLIASGNQIRVNAVPVPDLDGLLLLATLGIGLVAILVDLAAVGLRRPALAGLPMLAIYSVPVAVLPDGVSFLTFAAAGAGYLWLLISDSVDRVRRFGRRFSGEGRDVDIWEPSPLSAAGRRLGSVVLVLAILVPLAVPNMSSIILSTFGPAGGQGNGEGPDLGSSPVTTVDMNALLEDNLTLNETVEMVVVRTTDATPYYLRLGTAERVDEAGFHADLPQGDGTPLSDPSLRLNGPAASAGEFQAQIEVVGLSLGLAPIYDNLTGVNGLDDAWARDESTGQVFSRRRNINGTTYTIDYSRPLFTPEALRTAGPINDGNLQALTTVPVFDEVNDLVAELTAGQDTQYDQVRALYDYFSPENDFRYSLSTVEGDSGSAIVDFLENKRGFCVQYAAALAWLVRSAGYPARVAFGYTRGSGARDGVYTLTNLNLHAWTEVYFDGFGWVPFDATPANGVPGSTRTAWAPPIDTSTGSPQGNPQATVTPGPTGQPRDVDEPGVGGTGDGGLKLDINPWYVVAGAGVVVLILLLLAPSLQRRALRRRRRSRTGTVIALTPPPPGQEDLVTDPAAMTAAQRDAHNAWAELLDTMIDYGVLVDPAETPRATASRLSTTPELGPTGRPPTTVLARAEERARYAPAPVRASSLDEAVREARRAFSENATRLQQLSAWLFPRSVLMRWRLGWYGFRATTDRRIGRVRDIVLLVPLRERRHRR
jgi:TgpA N-terminal domain/Transglutaminase-like superfamily/Domain of unknown function (DUF4129)